MHYYALVVKNCFFVFLSKKIECYVRIYLLFITLNYFKNPSNNSLQRACCGKPTCYCKTCSGTRL